MTSGTAGTLEGYLEAQRAVVDEALHRWLPAPPACPPLLHEAMRYSLEAGGKRFRPIVALAAAEEVAGGDHRAARLALPAACAIEWIHTYSLIHDDLPAMDNDTLRRGRPTSHVVFGDGLAILAGDGLLTEAFALLAREPAGPEAHALTSRKLRTIGVVAEAAGAVGMVGGQVIDLDAAGQCRRPGREQPRGASRSLDAEALRDMHARKTGALIRAAALAGAIMAGGDDAAAGAVGRYATELGLAFQIVDDVLDVEGASPALGKTAGKDAAAGKPTYPALYGVAESKRLAGAALERALAALASAGLGGRLRDLAVWVVSRSH
jgi:geranylgeranyl diphosphate synthase, type II